MLSNKFCACLDSLMELDRELNFASHCLVSDGPIITNGLNTCLSPCLGLFTKLDNAWLT
jgi:hypothetical protein